MRRLLATIALIPLLVVGAALGLRSGAGTAQAANQCGGPVAWQVSASFASTSVSATWAPVVNATGYCLVKDGVQVGTADSSATSATFTVDAGTRTLQVVTDTPSSTTTTAPTTTTTAPPTSTFDCYGAGASCYTPAGCTTTISSDVSGAIAAAAPGDVICLTEAGSPYGDLTTSATKTKDVTVQAAPGAVVTIGAIGVPGGSHLTFQNLTAERARPAGATHVHFRFITFTSASAACTSNPCNAGVVADADVTFEHDRFDNIQNGDHEARLLFFGHDGETVHSGFSVTDSHFGGTGLNGGTGGCSDGVGMAADVSGVTIGPGNEFEHLVQGSCGSINGAHVDPIQSYIAADPTVTGDYFHDNGDGTGGLGWFSGANGTATITYNVFACNHVYPFPVAIPGTPGAMFQHNVITGGCMLEIGKDNQCQDSTGMVARDNVWTTGGRIHLGNLNACSPGPDGVYTADHNLNCGCTGDATDIGGDPVFSGGASPTSYAGYRLAPGSPGKGAASDGTDMGIK